MLRIVYDDTYYLLLLFPHVDVYIDVPDTIDISPMRSKGLQPGEELLPDAGMLSWLISSFNHLGVILKVKY